MLRMSNNVIDIFTLASYAYAKHQIVVLTNSQVANLAPTNARRRQTLSAKTNVLSEHKSRKSVNVENCPCILSDFLQGYFTPYCLSARVAILFVGFYLIGFGQNALLIPHCHQMSTPYFEKSNHRNSREQGRTCNSGRRSDCEHCKYGDSNTR